jgi:hypothetical protein
MDRNFADAGWDIDDAGSTDNLWRIYDHSTTPLTRAALAPLTLTPDSARVIYDRNAHSSPGNWTTSPANVNTSVLLGTGKVTGSGMQGVDDSPAGFVYSLSDVLAGDDARRIGNLSRPVGECIGSRADTLGSMRAGSTDYVTVLACAQAFTITQAFVVITPGSGQSKIEGSADPVLIYTASGLAPPTRPLYWDATGSDKIAANENDSTGVRTRPGQHRRHDCRHGFPRRRDDGRVRRERSDQRRGDECD